MPNIQEWLQYIEDHYHYQHGGVHDSLPRLRGIAKKLNLDTPSNTVITIGGTNGKGSCVIYLESMLLAYGYKVGAYISPHILHFNERIRINGNNINDAKLVEAFSRIHPICKDSEITYFEFITLATLYIFKNTDLDIILLEVGLGGRFDAVNIIDSDISVITTISFDHTQQLGNTLEQIGYEKAGIMRPLKPCICGSKYIPNSIINYAQSIQTKLYCLNKDFYYSCAKNNSWSLKIHNKKLDDLPLPKLSLQDAATAIMTISLLPDFSAIPKWDNAIKTGLRNAKLLGRFQTIRDNPLVIIDVAHNPESTQFLAEQLANQPISGKTFAVVGILKDKDIKNTLEPMIPQIDQWFVGSLDTETKRGASSKELIKFLDIIEAKLCYNCKCMYNAYRIALSTCTDKDRIIVFGSFYTITNILKEEIKRGN